MSEQNILNTSAASLLNCDYGYTEGLPETRSLFQAMSGKPFARRQLVRGRIYDLIWNNRDLTTKLALQQWAQQYENDFFSLADWERSRYFSGRFEGPLSFSPTGNQKYTIRGRFIELPGLAMFAAPTNWTQDAIFLEERNGFGEDLVKLTGSWTFQSLGSGHGGSFYDSLTTNDIAEWLYCGYGFQFYEAKNSDRGIGEITCTRVRDAAIVSGPTNVDFYSAGSVNSAALLTVAGLPLDLYRVKLRVTGTKNASSSNFHCQADAIQVMQ